MIFDLFVSVFGFFARRTIWVQYDVYFYIIIFGLFVYGLLSVSDYVKKVFKGVSKNVWVVLGLLILLGGFIRVYNIDYGVPAQTSTWEYINGGRYFSHTGRIFKCYGPSFLECEGPNAVTHPAMYSLLIGVLFSVFGFSLPLAINFMWLISLLTIPLAFFVVKEITQNFWSGLFSAALVAVFPLFGAYMVLDGSIAFFSVFSIFVSLLASIFVIKNDDKASWLFLFGSFVFMFSFRWEHPLAALFIFLTVVFVREKPFNYLKNILSRKYFWLYVIFFGLLSFVPLKGVYEAFLADTAGGGWFTFEMFLTELSSINHLFAEIFGLPGLIAALMIPFAFFKKFKVSLIMVLWFTTYTVMYLFFRNGLSHRYAFNLFPPLIVLAGLGFSKFTELKVFDKLSVKLSVLLIILVSITSLHSFSFVGSSDISDSLESFIYNDLQRKEVVSDVTGDTPVLFSSTNGKIAYLTYIIDEPVYSFLNIQNMIGVVDEFYFVWDEGCNFDQYTDFCKKFKNEGELVRTFDTDEKTSEKYWNLYYIELTQERRDYFIEGFDDWTEY